MPPAVSMPPQPVESVVKRSERMGRPGYQDLQCGLSEGGSSKASSTLQGKAEPRFLETSMSGSRQDTSGAAEGPLAEHGPVVEKRGPPSVTTPKSVGQALRTDDFKINGFPPSLLKSRGMGTKARTGVQSPMLSFRSLLEGAICASGVQPPPSVYKIAEGEPSLRGDTIGSVSYSSLLQAQLGEDPVEVTAALRCKTAGTLHLNVETRSPPVKLPLPSAAVEGGFLALLNQTTRFLAPVTRRPSLPQADSGVHFSDKLLQAVAGDVSQSTDMVSERDASDSLEATTVPASAVLARSEDDVLRAEVVVERRSSLVADSIFSDEDASGTPFLEEDGDSLAGNESRSADILPERVAMDFSEAATVIASPVLTRVKVDFSPADVVVADSAPIVDEMSDAQLFEEISRGLAMEESRFAENASNMGAIESPEAAAASTSPVPTKTQQGFPREEVVVTDSVSTDEKALDVQLSEDPSGTLGVDELPSAHNVPKRDVITSSEASAVPLFTRLEMADLPVEVDRASCVAADSMSGEENASDVQPPEEAAQALALDESRSGEIVSERDAIDSSETAAEIVVTGWLGNDEEISDVFVSDDPSQALALDESRNTDIVTEGNAAKLSDGFAEPGLVVPLRTREDVILSEASVEKDVGLCGDAVVHSEQGNGHLLSFKFSDEQVLDERIQFPSQRLETENSCADDRDGLIDAGTTSVSCQAGLKETGDTDADTVDVETMLKWSCESGLMKMVDVNRGIVGLREDNFCEVQRNCMLAIDCEIGETSPSGCRSDLIAAGTVFESPEHAVSKQTDNQNAFSVEDHKDEMCDANMPSPTENVSLNSKADINLSKFVLEKEIDISKGGPVDSVHTEVVKTAEETVSQAEAVVKQRNSLVTDSMCAVEETLDTQLPEGDDGALPVDEPWSVDSLSKRFSPDSQEVAALPASHVPTSKEEDVSSAKVVVDPVSVLAADSVVTDEQMLDAELFEELTGGLGESVSPCAEDRSDEGAVVRSSWQAGPKHIEIIKEDNICHAEMREDLMGQNAGAIELHLIGSDYGSGPVKSCDGPVEMTSTTASPHANGNLLVAERIHTDGGDQMVSEKVEEDHILGYLEDSNEVVKRPEVGQHRVDNFANGAPEVQRAISSYLESRAGLFGSESGYESEQVSPSEFLVVELGIRNEEERVPEGYAGEIVYVATDSGNSGVPADQALSTDPDALSEGLRQGFLRDNDDTVSGSLECVQVSGPEIGVAQEAGKEVQSPLGSKSRDRQSPHVDNLEDMHTSNPDDHSVRRTRHLDELEDNGNQPYVPPLNGTVYDQLVRPLKKRGRPRAYNHDKALHETGRFHLHPSGSEWNKPLQNTSNRCRRNQHINADHPVPILVEGHDEGFYNADGGAFYRWLAHQDKRNAVPPPAVRKRVRKHDQELAKSMIATPSFRVVPDYEDTQHKVEKRTRVMVQQHPGARETLRASDYDMDDEDERWLLAWNKRLARGGLKQPISEDKFEEMIEYFERMYARMEVAPAGDVPGFLDRRQSSAHSVPGSSLPSTSPSGLDCLMTNPATPVILVPENAPALNPPRIRSGHRPWTGSLKDVSSSGKQAVLSSAIRVDSIGGGSTSPASTVLFHTLTSVNDRNICESVADTVTGKPSEGSLQKSFEPPIRKNSSDVCCICNGGEDHENNPVYTCKRCLIHVHQSCYGIREKFRDVEGQVFAPSSWCCRKCEAVAVGRAQPKVSCALCRKRGGALKPTVVPRKWAHVACALYTNETFFVDPDAMEPIDGIAAVAARAQDRQDRCGLCGVKKGVCSLCTVKDCRAPFHISCGVSQGASFELRQSKQKVVHVRSFCPRHAYTTPTNSAASAGLKKGHILSSITTSGATAFATASGSISTATSMDYREGGSSWQSTSHLDGSFVEPAKVAGIHVADLTDDVMSLNGKGIEDVGRERSKSIRFTLKRIWDESCAQVSDFHKKFGNGRGLNGDDIEAPGYKSTWHVVEPGQKLKKIKFKFGMRAQSQDPESSPTLVQQERIGSEDLEAEKINEIIPAVGDASGDATVIVNGLSDDRFAKELKELTILGEAMKSGVAPVHIMREAFVYWRAKRAECKGSLLCELNHKQLSKSQGIFKIPGDPKDVGNLATGNRASPMRVSLAQQLSCVSTDKMLEKAKELREQLDRVRSMAQMVVQREKVKYNQQLVLMTIASVELNRAESVSEERRCVWCPSTKTLLKCGTCPRSFCFNCFKHRKGFGVKGWMAAMKHRMYSCKYCQELSSKVADLSNNLDPAPKEIAHAGLVSNPVIPSEPVDGMFGTPTIEGDPGGGGTGKGMGKGRGKAWGSQGFDNPDPASLRLANRSVNVNEDSSEELGIGRGKGNRWTVNDNAGPGSSRRGSASRGTRIGAFNPSKPSQLAAGFNKFLSITNGQMEHSSFETTLRRLKILGRTNTHANQQRTEIPSGDIQ